MGWRRRIGDEEEWLKWRKVRERGRENEEEGERVGEEIGDGNVRMKEEREKEEENGFDEEGR